MLRFVLMLLVVVVLLAIGAIYTGYVHIGQTQALELPAVKLEGGQAPAFRVDTPQVDVSTANTTVDVPTVSVGTKPKSVEVPTVDVKKPQ